MLNQRGGYEADVTITRVAHDEFLLVTGSASIVRDLDWISRHIRPDAHVVAVDVTSSYAVFGVMGPASRDLLQGLTRADLSDPAFPFATSQVIDLGYSTVRATRITYVGELGWELYVPTEFAVGVYELLIDAGPRARPGRRPATTRSTACGWTRATGRSAADIGPDDNPVEAGLLFACKLGTDIDFLGREAVEKVQGRRARGAGWSRSCSTTRSRCCGAASWCCATGWPVGQVRSAGWSQTLGAVRRPSPWSGAGTASR